jgi:RNA polymerase sigma-70 factor (ECF subfamily)
MRTRWVALHQGLTQSVRSLDAGRRFEEAKKQKQALARFADPVSLLAYLTSKAGDLDEKDAIYAALVELVQAQRDGADIAMSLLWLGLWPALDAIFRHRQRHFDREPEELVSQVAERFTALVQRIDLTRVSRVASTLAWSTDRDIGDRLKIAWARAAKEGALPEDESLGEAVELSEPSELGLPAGLSTEEEIAAIRAWLLPIVGNDADLVIGAAIYGENQHEVADRLGITHEAARKRFQRAMARIRERFQGHR